MKKIPKDVSSYKKTSIFDEKSTPAGLLRNHCTAEGVWGKIILIAGSITYHIHDAAEVVELSASVPGVIEPQMMHHIKPHQGARFYVEFFR